MIAVIAASAYAQQPPKDGQSSKKKKSNVDESESLFDYTKQVISSNAAFQFAVIANPEINAEDTANSPLKQAIREIKFRTDIAFVVVLGNITADGSTASLTAARDMLKKLEKQYYVVPGRKDINIMNAGGTEFKRIFGDDSFRANVNGVFFLGLNTTLLVNQEKGHFLPQKLNWLKLQLKNAGKKIPIYIYSTDAINEVDNWFTITDMVRHYNVQMMTNNQQDTFARSTIDGIPMRTVESLPKAYTICRVKGDTMVMDRKMLKGKSTPVDTTVIEAKMYLEPDASLPRTTAQTIADKKAWQFQAPAAVYTKVTANEQFCYFGDDRGVVYCLDLKKGKLKWKYQTALRIISQPMLVGNLVLIGSCDKNLYCLDATTGAFMWRVRTGRPITSKPAVVEDRVYAYKNDSILFTIDLKTGDEYRSVRRETIEMPPFEMPENGKTPLNDTEYIVTTVDGVITKYLLKKD